MKKVLKATMKATAAAAFVFAITACGGGGGAPGGGAGGGADGNPGVDPVVATGPIDPITGVATADPTTSVLSGVVYADRVTGATVTAYSVQADGSDGAVLGTSTVTAADGTFTINLSAAPAGMVRLIATGGTFTSEADATTQPIEALELVTPYVTNTLNSFAITPVTHIASRNMRYQAGNGVSLVTAFNNAWALVFGLSGTNIPLKGDERGIVNILSTVPGTGSDLGTAYQDLVTALEWFGVKYDLPSKVVFRIVAAAGEGGFGANGVDGYGNAVNVGAWVGSFFDENQVRALDKVMELPKANPSDPTHHEDVKTMLSVYIIRDFHLDAACKDVSKRSDLIARYPALGGFFGSSVEAGGCLGAANRISDLQAKIASNTRSAM